MMADTPTMPLCTLSQSVACATLTQQSTTAVRSNWVTPSEKAGYHEGICGSQISCGVGTMDTKMQRKPAWTPARGWGLNTLVLVVRRPSSVDKDRSHCYLLSQYHTASS